ncbi:hypothetical protein [Actinomadura geliboluensis]|uniref:Uncharacterized protein n=1 Tax=Actinomadura geliboluensis TaxID=882440 RepID=A0A5S4H6U1_9ACTN|nr:hypothetical protein [Actinomadura geliboluensis]TMR40726.1 hypothetical protein ETD96_09140 [Actinomadura geliboluensis]
MSGDERPDAEVRRTADILFTASIKADELRFEVVPESSVEFSGDASAESSSGSSRTNVPDEAEAHVTYRDVQIDYAIAAKLQPPDSDVDG